MLVWVRAKRAKKKKKRKEKKEKKKEKKKKGKKGKKERKPERDKEGGGKRPTRLLLIRRRRNLFQAKQSNNTHDARKRAESKQTGEDKLLLLGNLQLPQQGDGHNGQHQVTQDIDARVDKGNDVLVHAHPPGGPLAPDDFPPEVDGPAGEECPEDGPQPVDDDEHKVDFEELLHVGRAEDAVALDCDGHLDEHEGEGVDPDCCP